MGKKNSQGEFDHHDDLLFADDLDIEAFEQEQFEKTSHSRGDRKARRKQAARKRFSDYEEQRWLKRQARDWDQYDTIYDDDDVDTFYTAVE